MRRLRCALVVAGAGLLWAGCRAESEGPPRVSGNHVVHQATTLKHDTMLWSGGAAGALLGRRVGPETSEAYGPGPGAVSLVGASPDGSAVVIAFDGEMYRIDVDVGPTPHPLNTQGSRPARGVAFDSSSTQMAYASDDGVYVRQLRGESPPVRVAELGSGSFRMAFSSDGRFVIVLHESMVQVAAVDGSAVRMETSYSCTLLSAQNYLACSQLALNLETMTYTDLSRGAQLPRWSDVVAFVNPYVLVGHGSGNITRLLPGLFFPQEPEHGVVVAEGVHQGQVIVLGDRIIFLSERQDRPGLLDLVETSVTGSSTSAITLKSGLAGEVQLVAADSEAVYLCEGTMLLRVEGETEAPIELSDDFDCEAAIHSRYRSTYFADTRPYFALTDTHLYFTSMQAGWGAVPIRGGPFSPASSVNRWVATQRGPISHLSSKSNLELWATAPGGQSTLLTSDPSLLFPLVIDDWVFALDYEEETRDFSTHWTRVGNDEARWSSAKLDVLFPPHGIVQDHFLYVAEDTLWVAPLASAEPKRALIAPEGHWSWGMLGASAKVYVVDGADRLLLIDLQGDTEVLSEGPVSDLRLNGSGTPQLAWLEGSSLWLYQGGERRRVSTVDSAWRPDAFYEDGRYLGLLPADVSGPNQIVVDTRQPDRDPIAAPPGRLENVRDGRMWMIRDAALLGYDLTTQAEVARFEDIERPMVWHPAEPLVATLRAQGLAVVDLNQGVTELDDQAREGVTLERGYVGWEPGSTRLAWASRVGGTSRYKLSTYSHSSGEIELITTDLSAPEEYRFWPEGSLVYVEQDELVLMGPDGDRTSLTPPDDSASDRIIGIARGR